MFENLTGLVPSLDSLPNWGASLMGQHQLVLTLVQFFAVFAFVSWFYFKIHGTYAAQLLKGVTLILALYLISGMVGLHIISGVLQAVLQISIIGFIILFQPELRRLLVYLGQPDLLARTGSNHSAPGSRPDYVIHDILESVRLLSKTKTGALIVLEGPTSSGGSYLEAGTRLDARLSTEVLLTIFHPNTPLHDGAVIISQDFRIAAAGVLLPLSENPNLTWKFGTRHRAAVGLSEMSDSQCIVVSEETGNISLVSNGNIDKMASLDDLKHNLERFWGVEEASHKRDRRSMFSEIFSSDILQKLFAKSGS